MIVEIYGLLILLSIAFVIIGYQYDSEVLRMIGFLTILIIGVAMITDGIDYVSGSNITEVTSSLTTVDKVYTNYENDTIGFMLSIIGAVSFVLTFFELKNSFRKGD